MKIPVEISARHVHLSSQDLDKLFGPGYELKKLKDLSQPGEFAAEEKVTAVKDANFTFRIVGPTRKQSQIEIAASEAKVLGLKPPLRLSGHLCCVWSKLEVAGPQGKTKVKVIRAKRHLHCSPADAEKLNIKNNSQVKVKIDNSQGMIFDNVIVRVGENYKLACHLDIDEANASGLGRVCGFGHLVK